MTDSRPGRKKIVAILLATIAALFGRAWLQIQLQSGGVQRQIAADLSYLVVPGILLLLLGPVLVQDKRFLLQQFRASAISLRLIVNAILVGLLLRLISWAKLIAGAAFGYYRNPDPGAVEGPRLVFQCAAPDAVLLGFLVMALLLPLIEEVTFRAYIQSFLQRQGPAIAVLVSAFAFAVFHKPSGWSFSLLAGIVFGVQYWNSRSLWPSLISHATVNALIQIDWRCLQTQWNPPASELPLWFPGALSIVVLLLSMSGIVWLLKKHRGS